MKKVLKTLFVVSLFILIGTINTYATDDTVAPVFDPNIQTFYLLQRSEENTPFVPENLIGKVTATDDVDGKDVSVTLDFGNVDLSQDGQYQLLYTATDKSGNASNLVITILVDGLAPEFDEVETTYYMDKDGKLYNSNHEIVESLPSTIVSKDSMGAYNGIGVYITDDEQGNILFVGTIENSPAVGLIEVNDILLEVDGESLVGQTSSYAAYKIKGSNEEQVVLKILRNNQEIIVPVKKALIKLYEEQEFLAVPNTDITKLENFEEGKLEITYTATDAAGNTSEIVITVVMLEEEDTNNIIKEELEAIESEELEDITTSGNPPEDEIEDESIDEDEEENEIINEEELISDEQEEIIEVLEESIEE